MSALPIDQAVELRGLMRLAVPDRNRARVIAVASGKGGVGKTNVAVNLALCLARRGRRVVLVDADLGTANADLLLDLRAPGNLSHALRSGRSLSALTVERPLRFPPSRQTLPPLRVVVGASGLSDASNLSEPDRRRLLDGLSALEADADILILDCGAGVSDNVTAFASAADDLLVVTTPEPTALTDAYALVKIMAATGARPAFHVVVNQAAAPHEGHSVAERMSEVAARFLGCAVHPAGVIPRDPHVPAAVRRRAAVVEAYPQADVSAAFSALARRFDSVSGPAARPAGFFRRIADLFY